MDVRLFLNIEIFRSYLHQTYICIAYVYMRDECFSPFEKWLKEGHIIIAIPILGNIIRKVYLP